MVSTTWAWCSSRELVTTRIHDQVDDTLDNTTTDLWAVAAATS